MVRNRLDLLDTPGVGLRKIGVQRAQGGEFRAVDPGKLRQGQFAEGDEILDLDADAVADEGLLGKIIGEFLRFITVAPVDGRNGGEGS